MIESDDLIIQRKLLAEGNLPKHIAIIMDGNGRWAKERGKSRTFGHREGVNSVRDIVKACGELKIKYLTLYTFSSENWLRPKEEVTTLMRLLVHALKKETKDLKKNNDILYAEENKILRVDNVPNDPDYHNQWGLNAITAESAWDMLLQNQGKIVVGVIDSGVEKTHHDLANRIAPGGYNFILNNSDV